MQQKDSTAAAEILDARTENGETPDLIDLADSLQKAKELIDCIYLAAHGLGDRMKMNAIVRVASDAANVIHGVRDHLENFTEGNAGGCLSKMLAEHAKVTAAINRPECDADEANKLSDEQCEIARAIIGYRALTKLDERRKAEFLHKWTQGTLLTEKEQKALIASMLPEGGAA